MNIVFIVPTGVGAEIGGHAGDATPAARLIGSVCDRIILHPNVVNASDINEMPPNAFYVDGHMLDGFLAGDFGLQPVTANRILVAINPRENNSHIVNAVSASRSTLGVNAEIIVLKERLILYAEIDSRGCATGTVTGTNALIEQVRHYSFDALAIVTEIDVPRKVAYAYFKQGGVNPWGAVESIACKPISQALRKPVAHAPIDSGTFDDVKMVCDARMSAEFVSVAYLFCVIKGLHRAPQRIYSRNCGLWSHEIDLLISPDMEYGYPHDTCRRNDIPIMVVEENATILPRALKPDIRVANYHEAAGVVACIANGIHPNSVRRPLLPTKINTKGDE